VATEEGLEGDVVTEEGLEGDVATEEGLAVAWTKSQ
jgi:hypothetical protein